ncbi:Thiol:disulfide interchange protein [Hahella chejuensis KCTC 2396]|uniref:Thiol:disulfide interchange protein n=1 Tax=Hahella chejuensis (strain KCTC 2396) TaxID=349521 RepID=Q2SGY5_HAHCH|nr:protein-disulfide reductase DsbD domain-containing protein [Hahella chejuensis]ABC30089.1 Thiol:disulfide interchange protein [Hahella chejuensis KCTC 2396]
MQFLMKMMVWLVALIGSLQVLASEQTDDQRLLSISILLESENPAAGGEYELALTMTPKQGWHGYWLNPGDAGFPTRLSWRLPQGVKIGEAQYPAPSQLLTTDIMNYVYPGEYTLLTLIKIDKGIAAGSSLPIKLDASYLVCNSTACLPEQQTIETSIIVGDGKASDSRIDTFSQWRQKLPRPLAAKGRFSVDNGKFVLALPLPDSIRSDNAHIYPIMNNTIVNSARQSFTHDGDTLRMQTNAGDELGELFQGVLVLDNGVALSFEADKADPAALISDRANSNGSASKNTWVIGFAAFFGAILGGLLLNIMPCVFPILSLKILSLTQQGSKEEARTGSVAYTSGAILVCVLLGGVILGLRAVGHQIGWAFQLQSPAVIAALIVLMSAIGFNLAGLFEIGTLTSGSRLQDKKGPMGDFWTGVLAAFVATPCTGPFMATALGAALVLPTGIAFMIFAGLGFGMALPILLVGFIPALRAHFPKPGAWMTTARRVLSLPMFITVIGLVWVLMRQANNDYVLSVLAATMLSTVGLWVTGLWQQSQRRGEWWPAIALTLLPFWAVISWIPPAHAAAQIEQKHVSEAVVFSQDKLEAALAENDVFLYFTADWCLTCKVNEKTSIDQKQVKDAFEQNSVVTMVGDWTNGDSEITEFLSRHGRSGVPLYLWYRQGVSKPTVLPQILTPSILVHQAGK